MENDGGSTAVEKVVPIRRRLRAEEILLATDFKTVEVEVPEWNGVVLLRSLSAAEALTFADEIKKDPTLGPVRLLVKCLVDDEGSRIFSDADVEKLKTRSMAVVTRLQDVALELNGLGKAAEKAAAEAKKS